MARARVNQDGDRVRVSLSFEEASALYALLLRVGPETHESICEITMSLCLVLGDVREEVVKEDPRIWTDWDEFTSSYTSLRDPDTCAHSCPLDGRG